MSQSQLGRIGSDTALSTHSSLEEEDIDLEREQKRKMSKIGHHQSLGFTGAAYATNVAGKQRRGRRKQNYDIASALRVSGAVAIAGVSWCPKELSRKKTKENGMFSTAIAATAVAKGKKFHKRDKSKTIATALKAAGGLAVAAASWTPTKKISKVQQDPILLDEQGHTMKGAGVAARAMVKANTNYKRFKEYSLAEALRTAGGVAIAGTSWTRPLRKHTSVEPVSPARTAQSIELQSRQVTAVEQPILVDMATSPIPQYETLEPVISTEPTPSPVPLTPEVVPLVLALPLEKSLTPSRSITPVYSPSIPPKSAVTPAIVTEPKRTPTPVIVVQPTRSPTPLTVIQPVKTPTPSPRVTPQPNRRSPNPVATTTVVNNIIKEESRPRSSRSRNESRRAAAALLLAANARNRRSPSPKARTSVVEPQKPPSPRAPTKPTPSPPPIVVHKEEIAPAVELQPPTPAEVTTSNIEEIVIPEEQALTVAAAAAGVAAAKPKRKPLAQLTPLEILTAKARSLQ